MKPMQECVGFVYVEREDGRWKRGGVRCNKEVVGVRPIGGSTHPEPVDCHPDSVGHRPDELEDKPQNPESTPQLPELIQQ